MTRVFAASGVGRRLLLFLLVVVVVVLLVVTASGPRGQTMQLGPTGLIGPSESVIPLDTGVVVGSKDGLNLSLFLSSGVFYAGHPVTVTIDLKNPTDSGVFVPSANNWAVSGLSLGPCGMLNYPMGIGVLAGYYTSDNISAVSRDKLLMLYKPGTYWCPTILSGIKGYSFPAMRNTAGIIQEGVQTVASNELMNVNVTFSGHWAPHQRFKDSHPGTTPCWAEMNGEPWLSSIFSC